MQFLLVRLDTRYTVQKSCAKLRVGFQVQGYVSVPLLFVWIPFCLFPVLHLLTPKMGTNDELFPVDDYDSRREDTAVEPWSPLRPVPWINDPYAKCSYISPTSKKLIASPTHPDTPQPKA